MKERLVFAAMCLLLAQPAWAQLDYGFDFSKSGSAGYQFLKIGLSAREIAMGGAAAALTNDANAVFWNVGALSFVDGPQVTLSHNQWLVGSSMDAAVVAMPLGAYTLALSVARFAVEEFEETTVVEPDGTGRMVSAGDMMLAAAASRRFTDRLTIGVQAKYIREQLDSDSFANVLFDVGTVYFTGFRRLRLAFALQHFGPDVKGLRQVFRMPLLFRVGVADDLIDAQAFRLTSSLELVHPTDNVEWVNWGVESTLMNVLALRSGYRFNVDEGHWSFGAGIQTPEVGGVGLVVDYAYVPYGEIFGATHRLTASVRL